MAKIVLSWSGGKDSAFALHELRNSREYEVVALLTTITRDYDRISMHGVRRILLERQAEAVGVPLRQVFIPTPCTNEQYAEIMTAAMQRLKAEGIDTMAFGDLFLQDVRDYREKNLAQVGMKAVFPLWGRNTTQLADTFVKLGFRAIITCIDPRKLPESFVGRQIDRSFLEDLPPGTDPCGENGEFHSFVYDGPIFRQPVRFTIGEKVLRDGFWFCELVER